MEKIDAEPESEEEKEDTVDFSLFDVSSISPINWQWFFFIFLGFPRWHDFDR